jgi:hypothetical protein
MSFEGHRSALVLASDSLIEADNGYEMVLRLAALVLIGYIVYLFTRG